MQVSVPQLTAVLGRSDFSRPGLPHLHCKGVRTKSVNIRDIWGIMGCQDVYVGGKERGDLKQYTDTCSAPREKHQITYY